MKHGSLFSGIGGFDLAAEWMGWDNVFHCEWNEFGQKVLKHYWPKAISYEDITKTDFTIHRGQLDILTGGFPCQPYSQAGKRLGKEDERHLWPEMLRAIREIQPRWVVGENVFGLVNWNEGLVFHEVQADLETEGYEVQPFILPAAAVNAPHRRDRVWFVAYRNDTGNTTLRGSDNRNWQEESEQRQHAQFEFSRPCDKGDATDTGNQGLQRSEEQQSIKQIREKSNQQLTGCISPTWQNFPTQPPVRYGNDGISTRLDTITFSKWRNESIKAGGNAIVPQVALQIFKAIEDYERMA